MVPVLRRAGGSVQPMPGSPELKSELAVFDDADTTLLFLAPGPPCDCGAGHGYANLLVHVGTLAYACWLAALPLGLTACIHRSSLHAANHYARRHLTGQRHIATLAIGFEQTGPQTSTALGSTS